MFREILRPARSKETASSQRRIAVAGVSDGAGVSFLAGNLARYLSRFENVTLAELGKPHFWHALNGEKQFQSRSFIFYEDLLARSAGTRFTENRCLSMNLLLRRPGSGPLPPDYYPDFCGSAVVADCSRVTDAYLEKTVLSWADRVILVADPLPSALLPGFARLQRLLLTRPDTVLVFNRFCSGVPRGELNAFLGRDNYLRIPCIPAELICKAEYNCSFVMDLPAGSRLMEKYAEELKNAIELHN